MEPLSWRKPLRHHRLPLLSSCRHISFGMARTICSPLRTVRPRSRHETCRYSCTTSRASRNPIPFSVSGCRVVAAGTNALHCASEGCAGRRDAARLSSIYGNRTLLALYVGFYPNSLSASYDSHCELPHVRKSAARPDHLITGWPSEPATRRSCVAPVRQSSPTR
jgi:hypothetical protein